MTCFVYILKCSDNSYYTGSTTNLERRFAEHKEGLIEDCYTHSRRPVSLVWSQAFATHDEAFRCEQQVKGWSRAKKEALIRGDWNEMRTVIKAQKDKRTSKTKPKQAP
jgi:predicted GIY-YIG superfamily endonuclease